MTTDGTIAQTLARFEAQIEALDEAMAGLPRRLLDRPSSKKAGTIRRWVHHLADTALVGACRVRAIVAEPTPPLAAHDFAAWETRLAYDERPTASSLALYRLARRSTLDVLHSLAPEAWERTGRHGAHGDVTLRELVAMQCDDAAGHIDDIRAERADDPGAQDEATRRALIVVDVLVAIFELGVDLHDAAGFLARTEELVKRARQVGIPVVYIQHQGRPGSPLEHGTRGAKIHPRVEPRAGDPVILKREPDSFQGSDLARTLEQLGAEELLVCGFATQDCVDATVRSAFSKGYRVVLVSDCHTTTDNEVLAAERIVLHHNTVLRRFATVTKLADLGLA